MKNFLKNWDTPSLCMVVICVLAIIALAASSNINGAIWAFNTLLWVGIAKENNDTANNWRDLYKEASDLYDKVSKELNEYKNNEIDEK